MEFGCGKQGEQRLNGVIALQHKGIWLPPELPGLNTWEVVNIEVRNSHHDLNPHICTKKHGIYRYIDKDVIFKAGINIQLT